MNILRSLLASFGISPYISVAGPNILAKCYCRKLDVIVSIVSIFHGNSTWCWQTQIIFYRIVQPNQKKYHADTKEEFPNTLLNLFWNISNCLVKKFQNSFWKLMFTFLVLGSLPKLSVVFSFLKLCFSVCCSAPKIFLNDFESLFFIIGIENDYKIENDCSKNIYSKKNHKTYHHQ